VERAERFRRIVLLSPEHIRLRESSAIVHCVAARAVGKSCCGAGRGRARAGVGCVCGCLTCYYERGAADKLGSEVHGRRAQKRNNTMLSEGAASFHETCSRGVRRFFQARMASSCVLTSFKYVAFLADPRAIPRLTRPMSTACVGASTSARVHACAAGGGLQRQAPEAYKARGQR
jgi:hypothetical protein